MVYVLIDSSCRACCCFYAAAIRGTLCCCTLYCCSQRHFHHSCKRPNHQANRQGSCVVKAFHKGCAALDPMGCAPARLLRQCAHIVMHDSTLQTSCVQGQLVGLALSFLRNFGILSGASGVLGALSSGVASAALDDRFAVQRAQQKQVSLLLQSDSIPGGCASVLRH